ncbi:hypothetical protein B0T24DRAFT_630551 [Lasiosphaeria ovina]|uniref:Uncharacterized protein n=1 Tax=Lasiosphaeria ovina TaxID=92902 RepID=A0AAE0K861_9PEZI|nr:hypothetical protein B0T24DRAFT_630551 [Lasiosphaeria ovina]
MLSTLPKPTALSPAGPPFRYLYIKDVRIRSRGRDRASRPDGLACFLGGLSSLPLSFLLCRLPLSTFARDRPCADDDAVRVNLCVFFFISFILLLDP